mgnify:CR=1 FL=1
MVYIFENPETGEVTEVVQTFDEPHVYSRDGVKWNRVWTAPNAAIDSRIDPFDSARFVDKTANGKLRLGDLWDQSRDLSEKRKDKLGYDPIKEKHLKQSKLDRSPPPPVKIKKS